MEATSIRDRLIGRKRWSIVVETIWMLFAFCFFLLALGLGALSLHARMVCAVLGFALYLSGLFVPKVRVLCLRCRFDFAGLALRRRKKMQVQVCPHCGVALDGPAQEFVAS